jgi:sugar phosphate isomerase/epimerase
MLLSIHQNTSSAAGYRGSLEGWAKAGIQNVELSSPLLARFLENDTLPAAKRVLTDNGLTPVSAAVNLPDIWIPGPARAESLERWRRGCEQFANLGLRKVYSASITRREVTAEDFAATPDCIREAGDIADEYELTAMIEFIRNSTHLSTLTSSLKVIREAAHPNVKPMLDFFHFWSGLSKFEDLDLLEPGELAHAHFQDLLDTPRELIDNNSRLIPGDGQWFALFGSSPRRSSRGRCRSSSFGGSSSTGTRSRWGPRFARSAKALCDRPRCSSVLRSGLPWGTDPGRSRPRSSMSI